MGMRFPKCQTSTVDETSKSILNKVYLSVNGPETMRVIRSVHPACVLQGIAARWLSAHYKTIARGIARAMAGGLGFVTPFPNKQGKNAYFSKVSDASGTACDAVNVRKDCQHFGPPLWVVPMEERGPFGGPS